FIGQYSNLFHTLSVKDNTKTTPFTSRSLCFKKFHWHPYNYEGKTFRSIYHNVVHFINGNSKTKKR
ncbi:unnamed protein product, partial [Musa hybrid cultivar]